MRNYLYSLVLSVALPLQLFAEDTKHIEAKFKKQFPQLTIEEITASPIDGLYQVVANGNIVYVTNDGRFLMAGDIYDLDDSQHNLTESARKKFRLTSLKKIDEESMIIFAAKKPEYIITVFTDVDCSYCRKLHADINKLNDLGITVRYLAFPRTGPHSPTADKMNKIWCMKDKRKAFNNANEDKPIEGTICPNNGVSRGYALGTAIGVNGTPTIVFEDGTIFPGYLEAEKIIEAAKQIRAQTKVTQ
jgi:thiol:disulfide interchange protein DsbC